MKIKIIIGAALSLTACAPTLYPPEVDTPAAYVYASGKDSSGRIDAEWWRIFGDTTLDRLVERALLHNRNLAAAAASVEEARANLRLARAQFLPQLTFGATAEGEYASESKIRQNYTVEPALQWEISLFGALRNADRAAQAQLAAQEWAYRGVRLSLAAEVATTYFTLLEYERDLEIARSSCELRRASATLVDSMHRYGMSDGVALAQARSLVYSAEADIPRYTQALEQTLLSLGVLLGETPRSADTRRTGRRLSLDSLPAEVPAGLPSELLERRPDILQARYTMRQAAAKAGSARSARFPSIALTASGGIASASIRGLTEGRPWVWDAAASLTQPIFAFGKLRRAERAAVEAYNQTVHDYEQTVLTAFADVEQALASIETYRDQRKSTDELVMANDRIARMTQALYRSGMTDYLQVIDAQRELYTSQIQAVNLAAQQYINYVNLFKALGGGW